jgi:hypothetical protein
VVNKGGRMKKALFWMGIFISVSVFAEEKAGQLSRPEQRARKESRIEKRIGNYPEWLRKGFLSKTDPNARGQASALRKLADPYEPNNLPRDAYLISYGDMLENGVINPAGDLDYFKFTGTAGDTITIDIDTQILGSELDSYLYLYDVDSVTELESNDDWAGYDSRIMNYVLPSSGVFFIKVEEYEHPDEGGTGYSYHIWLTDVPIPVGNISGRVTNTAGDSLENVEVAVYDAVTRESVSHGYTDASGYYIVEELPVGGYKVKTYNWEGYVDLYYDSKTDWNSADIVNVSESDTTKNIDFSLYVGGKIKGYVYGAKGPLEDIGLMAFSPSGEWINGSYTDALGSYTIDGVPTGDCRLFASPEYDDTIHAFEWYNDKDDWSSADLVSVMAPDSVMGKDFTLEMGGFISGNVYEAKGPIEGAKVSAHIYISPWFGWVEYWYIDATGPNGSYELVNLRTGNYKAVASKSGYETRWWNDKPDSGTANLVPVTMPNVTPYVDFYLPRVGVAEGKQAIREFSFKESCPNPFARNTLIRYSCPHSAKVSLRIHDMSGRVVETLVDRVVETGCHTVKWDAEDHPSGIYLVGFQSGDYVAAGKIILIR